MKPEKCEACQSNYTDRDIFSCARGIFSCTPPEYQLQHTSPVIQDLILPIEGFHDAVRTPYALRPRRHVGFFGTTKYAIILYLFYLRRSNLW